MRKNLTNSFQEIYILNLHDNSRIKEISPDGTKDENVFDIQQGVCISLLISTNDQNAESKIYYEDLWGIRTAEYNYLIDHDIKKLNGKNYFQSLLITF